jgi:type I restriction enzyme, R subunit
VTITSRVKDAAAIAKEFRDRKRPERIAVSVDMLSTGYNCRDALNIGLMRPIFSPTEYIQIKGRGTRRYTFTIGNTQYEKQQFFLLDFCGWPNISRRSTTTTVPLKLPRQVGEKLTSAGSGGAPGHESETADEGGEGETGPKEIPVWEGHDIVVSREVVEVGEGGEKVDVMTFRGSFERDVKEFASNDPEMKTAIADEDDDAGGLRSTNGA